jgi:hypothetical protein
VDGISVGVAEDDRLAAIGKHAAGPLVGRGESVSREERGAVVRNDRKLPCRERHVSKGESVERRTLIELSRRSN